MTGRYTVIMAAQFDVFVVGSTDPSSAGEAKLASALAAKHGIPLAIITKAIAAKNLRAGHGLEQMVAQTLVRQLQSMGAVTVIRPSSLGTQNQGSTPNAQASSLSPPAISNPGIAAFGPPLGKVPGASPSPPASAFTPPRKGTVAPSGDDPFEPPKSHTPVIGITRERPIGTPPPPNQPGAPREDFMPDAGLGPRLELARGDRAGSADELSGLRKLPTNASATNLRDLGMAGKSGVEADRDPKNINLVRCVQHGLYYDKTKASGCRKCLSVAREMAGHFQVRNPEDRIRGGLSKHPAKWAFLGLALALFIGFLPAAYYAFGPGATYAKHSRVEQEILSRQPGTEEILRRFDQLETQIGHSRNRSMRNTGILWFAVAGIAMTGWFKLT